MTVATHTDDLRAELARHFAGRPAALEEGVLSEIIAGTWAVRGRSGSSAVPTVTDSGIAVIGLHGLILPRPTLATEFGLATALTDVRQQFDAAWADKKVTAVLLHIDSPGGAVDGLTETAAHIRGIRRRKPVLAIADTMAASAAYWLAAQASRLYAAPSAFVGSIGILTGHTDQSKALEQRGLKVTLVSAGKHKAERSETAPLAKYAKDYMQGQVDEAYQTFLDDVALGRRVSPGQVEDHYGQGRMLSAKRARDAGMVDAIATVEGVLSDIAKHDFEKELLERRARR